MDLDKLILIIMIIMIMICSKLCWWSSQCAMIIFIKIIIVITRIITGIIRIIFFIIIDSDSEWVPSWCNFLSVGRREGGEKDHDDDYIKDNLRQSERCHNFGMTPLEDKGTHKNILFQLWYPPSSFGCHIGFSHMIWVTNLVPKVPR